MIAIQVCTTSVSSSENQADQTREVSVVVLDTTSCKPSGNLKDFYHRVSSACTNVGGLIFGWNSFALILKAQGNYDRGCNQAISGELDKAITSI